MAAKMLLGGNGYAHEVLTVADSAKAMTAATYNPANTDQSRIRAFVTAEAGFMRYRYDGGDPTTTSGHLIGIGDALIIEGVLNIEKFRAIRVGDKSGTLRVTYERFE